MIINRNSRISSSHRCVIAGALALAIAAPAFGTASFAQGVPIPKPAPKARGSVQMSASEQKGPATTGATTAAVPDPIIPDPHRNVPASIFASFDSNQKAQAAKVSNYLSSLNTLVGNFVQVGPDGAKTKGEILGLAIARPGEREQPPTLVQDHLGDDVGRSAKAVDADELRVIGAEACRDES